MGTFAETNIVQNVWQCFIEMLTLVSSAFKGLVAYRATNQCFY